MTILITPLLCGIIFLFVAVVACVIFPLEDERTQWPAGTTMQGGRQEYNETMESYAVAGSPTYIMEDGSRGFAWMDQDNKQHITWVQPRSKQ